MPQINETEFLIKNLFQDIEHNVVANFYKKQLIPGYGHIKGGDLQKASVSNRISIEQITDLQKFNIDIDEQISIMLSTEYFQSLASAYSNKLQKAELIDTIKLDVQAICKIADDKGYDVLVPDGLLQQFYRPDLGLNEVDHKLNQDGFILIGYYGSAKVYHSPYLNNNLDSVFLIKAPCLYYFIVPEREEPYRIIKDNNGKIEAVDIRSNRLYYKNNINDNTVSKFKVNIHAKVNS